MRGRRGARFRFHSKHDPSSCRETTSRSAASRTVGPRRGSRYAPMEASRDSAPREAKGKISPAPAMSGRYGYPPGYGGYGGYGGYPPPQPTPTSPISSTRPDATGRDGRDGEGEAPPDAGVKIFGKRPLAAAIED